ncbi:cobaltochelatase subunit CobN [Nitratireductor pacificus]|uniref:Cobaltochelatase subunit CobN n=1 Tax=Nitratireductor pacificus pht-3B TaxID=391937 RepID=K2N564_9HYPH|nr:cobaltochelatase subunit CobN [Nitratireductor pacificus]EKF19358.1 cobaltochelatase subunit CobN [Nitratireductor pacificus pht-3B]
MHILATTTASLDDLIEPVDLRLAPAEMVALSFTDSDLAGMAAAWRTERDTLPSLRLAALRDLRHPMSVDLWLDGTAAQARVILVRVLGGYDWWRYGCDQLCRLARDRNIALALLPGEGQADDARLAERSTVSPKERMALLACFREGGPDNMRAAVRRMARLAGRAVDAPEAKPLARAGFYAPGQGIVPLDFFTTAPDAARPVVPILFYRSMLLAADIAPIDALADALAEQGISPVPVFVSSLREAEAADLVAEAVQQLGASALVTATAFSSGAEPGAQALFDRLGLPVFQVVTATTRRQAWEEGQRGLAPADLAMHVVLPELDGRIMAGAISFKDDAALDEGLSFGVQRNRPEAGRIRQVAARIVAVLALGVKPAAERRLAILLPDYPSAPGRTGYAVGLDVPASVLAMLHDLKEAGYAVSGIPETPRALMQALKDASESISLVDYKRSLSGLPKAARDTLDATWGPAGDDAEDGVFGFRAARFGNVTVALAPDRGRAADRRVDYHDPALAPRHALVAFGFWLRGALGIDALIHVGAHGTLEWLPGKTVALTENCFPEIVAGALPVIYPFIVSNPGEAAQAKRRIGAVTLGHLTPPLIGAGLSSDQQELERLVDEYAQADGLDRRRRDRLARLIVETAERTGLTREAGVSDAADTDAALMQIDAWLCDLKDFAIKDGLHIYGRASEAGNTPERAACADAERAALLAALDGRHIPPGPSGAPARDRTDVLPTGRNMFTADPRTLPTPTATALGKLAADEAVRAYLQEHGDWPRALVIDLWGSASLRTGGEEIAQGLALMGCRPQWDAATGRVTGIEVLPPASLGRPRVDVTWRISGLFRDMFPTQIALLDTASAAVAARDEGDDENPLAAAARAGGAIPPRVFGSAPGTYGAGLEEKLARGDWHDRAELGQAYLDGASHSFGGAEGEGRPAEGAFAAQVAAADMLLHTGDDAGRDILEGSADVAFIGGFAAAVEALGGKADLVVLDTTDPQRPRARSLAQAIARTVRARAVNPGFIAGQLRHGPRGAAELAETVDRLVAFAETTDAVPGALIEAVFDAYLGDEAVRAFLLHENPEAARAMAERFAAARRRGLWHPRRNAIDGDLAALIAEAAA